MRWRSLTPLSAQATSTYSIALTPAPLTFGNVVTGNVNAKTETVNNGGWKTVILTGARVSGTDFVLKSSPTFPYKLVAGSSVGFRIRFAPTSAGTFTGTLTVHYKYLASGTWHWTYRSVQLDGTGINSGFLTATPASETFGTVQTTYTDVTVQNGQTYYYAVTAVDSAGVESPHSNIAQAIIP